MRTGKSLGNLESFKVIKDGAPLEAVDFNFWGVTFAATRTVFYATLRTGGHYYLVEGNIASREMRVLRDRVECPSLSPDGTRIAYKSRIGDENRWRLKVLDLKTLKAHPVAERRPIDDQPEWLNDTTLVYSDGLDVYTVAADGSGEPRRSCQDASSPVSLRTRCRNPQKNLASTSSRGLDCRLRTFASRRTIVAPLSVEFSVVDERALHSPIGASAIRKMRSLRVSPCLCLAAFCHPARTVRMARQPWPALRPPANEIVCENSKPGNPAQRMGRERGRRPQHPGLRDQISVDRGETVRFKIDTPSTDYRLDIYRMGYYGGDGARKVATRQSLGDLPQTQPPCENGSRDRPDRLRQLGGLGLLGGAGQRRLGDLLREARPRRPALRRQPHRLRRPRRRGRLRPPLPDLRHDLGGLQQYGGNSLYEGGPGKNPGRAYKVSYNRPLTTRGTSPGGRPLQRRVPDGPLARAQRLRRQLHHRAPTSTATAASCSTTRPSSRSATTSTGRREQRANVKPPGTPASTSASSAATRSSGRRGGKTASPADTDHRTLVCYKETHANEKIDPESNVWTGTWRDPRFGPQDGRAGERADRDDLHGQRGDDGDRVPAADGKLRLWRNTDRRLAANRAETATLAANTLGYEWDEDLDNGFRPKGLFRLSSTTAPVSQKLLDFGSNYGPGTATHHLTEYRAPSGALVFGAGTIQWSWGLEGEHDRGGSTPDDGCGRRR